MIAALDRCPSVTTAACRAAQSRTVSARRCAPNRAAVALRCAPSRIKRGVKTTSAPLTGSPSVSLHSGAMRITAGRSSAHVASIAQKVRAMQERCEQPKV
eukprot:IDg21053t1